MAVILPVSYATLNCESEGFIVAVGQELSQLTALQQKLVSAQQTLERDYVQLRHVETRYRSLFNLVETPVLICKAESTEILEINPAAIRFSIVTQMQYWEKNWTSFSVRMKN